MSNGEIIVLTDVAQITCIVQKDLADVVIKAAQEVGALGATVYYARGGGVRESLGILGLAIEAEKEVIMIIVSTDQVDRVFERMYSAGKLDTPGMGMIYVNALEKAATYVPHDIVEKLAKPSKTAAVGS
jgi:nitrogen regulatory protein P-II 1